MNLQQLRIKLESLIDPSNNISIKNNGAIKHLGYDSDKDLVILIITMEKLGGETEKMFRRAIARMVKIECGFSGLKLELEENRKFDSIAKSKTIFIGIVSGKGGVGKSSIACNIAYRLAKKGKKVGIIDADIYGSSIPTILKMPFMRPTYDEKKKIIPLTKDNIEVISTEFFTDPSQPVIWRGGMLNSMLNYFFYDVKWRANTDYIIIDFPPGTGDITLDIKSFAPQTKIIVVTLPHKSASHVAVKAGFAAKSLNHEILGVIENMSYYTNPIDGSQENIFGEGGGIEVAENLDTELIARIPIAQPQDGGDIFDISEPNGQIYDEIADYIIMNKK